MQGSVSLWLTRIPSRFVTLCISSSPLGEGLGVRAIKSANQASGLLMPDPDSQRG
jgi:hypothetical protein